MPNFPKLRLPLVLLALGTALVASADQIVHDFSVDSATRSRTTSFDAFDPGLGTLTSVKIDFAMSNRGAVTYTNLGAAAESQFLSTYSRGYLFIYRSSGGIGYAGTTHQEDSEGPLASGGSFTSSLDYDGGPDHCFHRRQRWQPALRPRRPLHGPRRRAVLRALPRPADIPGMLQ